MFPNSRDLTTKTLKPEKNWTAKFRYSMYWIYPDISRYVLVSKGDDAGFQPEAPMFFSC